MPTLLPAQSYADSRIANALAACKSLVTLHPITCQVLPFRKKTGGRHTVLWDARGACETQADAVDQTDSEQFQLLWEKCAGRFARSLSASFSIPAAHQVALA